MTMHAASKLIKGEARHSLLGHLSVSVGANTLYALMAIGLTILASGAVPGDGLVNTVLSYVVIFFVDIVLGTLQFGLSALYMNLQYRQEATLSDLFRGFRESSLQIVEIQAYYTLLILAAQIPVTAIEDYYNNYGLTHPIPLLIATIVACVFSISLTLWATLSYALVWYILLDYPDMNWRDVLRRSRMLMKGNKRVLLYMNLSFIPLYLVSILSLGIASLWVKAYRCAAEAAFYRGLMHARQNAANQ